MRMRLGKCEEATLIDKIILDKIEFKDHEALVNDWVEDLADCFPK